MFTLSFNLSKSINCVPVVYWGRSNKLASSLLSILIRPLYVQSLIVKTEMNICVASPAKVDFYFPPFGFNNLIASCLLGSRQLGVSSALSVIVCPFYI